MKTDQVRCMGIVVAAWLAMLSWPAVGTDAGSVAIAAPGDSTLTVQFVDTVASPYSEFMTMAVYITTYDVPLAGLQLRLVTSRPDLVEFPDSAVHFPIVDFTGAAIAGWDFKDENRLTPQVLNIAGINNLPGGTTPAPLSPSVIPHRICTFTMHRIVPLSVLDTLQDRSVTIFAALTDCSFSDPAGTLIGVRDTAYCSNPPACTDSTFDTYDANTYVAGTLIFGPSCGSRGDVNSSGTINSSDIIFLVNYVFKGGPQPACSGVTGDVECSGAVTSSDIIYLVNFVFKGGAAPCS